MVKGCMRAHGCRDDFGAIGNHRARKAAATHQNWACVVLTILRGCMPSGAGSIASEKSEIGRIFAVEAF